jgi:cell division protein FtsW
MIDKPLLISVVILLGISLIMDYSLSVYTVSLFDYSPMHFFVRQAVAVGLGFIMLIIISKLDPDKYFKPMGFVIFGLFFLLMFIMQFLPSSLVNAVGGAKRWIHIGPMSIAPVEFFKIGFVYFLAWSFTRKFKDTSKMSFLQEVKAFAPYLVVFAVAVLLIAVFQKDLGQVAVLGATLVVMFVFVGSSWRFFGILVGMGMLGVVALIKLAPHRMARIKSWWVSIQDSILSIMPFDSIQNLRVASSVKEPWQISNSLNAIHNGGFFGQGLGNGQFKLGYLSEVHTDFILAGITEELGFLGVGFVSLLILYVVFRVFQIGSKVQNPMYYLFCIGVGLLIAFSFFLNAFGISGLTPIKGIAVPFLSYGGSHILASCVAIGMVLMISKKVPRDIYGNVL